MDSDMNSGIAAVVPRKANSSKMVSTFLREKNTYQIVYCALCLSSANCQKSRRKVRIYVDEKSNFSERGLALKGLKIE